MPVFVIPGWMKNGNNIDQIHKIAANLGIEHSVVNGLVVNAPINTHGLLRFAAVTPQSSSLYYSETMAIVS